MSEGGKGFRRQFKYFQLNKFENEEVFKLLKEDIRSGDIFPALRENKIDFYYAGGRIFLYKNTGFSYNTDYHKYMGEKYTSFSTENPLFNNNLTLKEFYEDLKKGVEKKFTSQRSKKETERNFLKELYKSTYSTEVRKTNTVILDVEMRFNNGNGKKCDLVLYNNIIQKLMLVEAKMIDNPEIKSTTTPKVIGQVKEYSSWINSRQEIIEQYSQYIDFINRVFGTNLNSEIKDICSTAKLVVFETEKELEDTHKLKLIEGLGSKNVLFLNIKNSLELNIDKIWNALDK